MKNRSKVSDHVHIYIHIIRGNTYDTNYCFPPLYPQRGILFMIGTQKVVTWGCSKKILLTDTVQRYTEGSCTCRHLSSREEISEHCTAQI